MSPHIRPKYLHMTDKFDLTNFSLDSFGLLIIIFACFYIYFQTKNIEKLSSHKGIEYFRKAFLFFGLSFLIRLIGLIFRFFEITQMYFDFFRDMQILINFIGCAYILYSLFWKKLNKEYYIYIGSILICMLLKLAPKNKWIFISILPLFLFSFLFLIREKYIKTKNKISKQILIIYMVLISSWIISGIGKFFTLFFNIERFYITFILSLFFIFILHKVINITKIK